MPTGSKRSKRKWGLAIAGTVVAFSFTILVMLQISNQWKRFSVDTARDTLLLYALSSLNFIAFVVFGFIFLRSIVKLVRERRASQVGSKLKTKLLAYFAAISLLPIFAMAGFSYLFMNRALERWFTSIPENVVRAPLEIENRANAERFDKLKELADVIAVSIGQREVSQGELDRLASAGRLVFIEVRDRNGRVAASSSAAEDLSQFAEFGALNERQLDDPSLADGSGIDAATARLPDGGTVLAVSAARDVESVGQMVDSTLIEFDRMKEQNVWVRQIGLLTFGVLTFLLIFAATWTAFYTARGLTVPIRALAEGAEKITAGELGHRVEVLAEDELALLVSSFNQMSSKLKANAEELEERRRYIETVLLSLSTGVISIDSENKVDTINPAARLILRLEPGKYRGAELKELLSETDRGTFYRIVSRAKRIGHASDQLKLRPAKSNAEGGGEAVPTAVTVTALPDIDGAVLVLEDLSELIAAQRATAWQEVARRMAHEIKNPLTPIQLSAERIAKRFSPEPTSLAGGVRQKQGIPLLNTSTLLDDQNSKVVLDGTDTILREVRSLKAMVDEFSRFARLPEVKLEPGALNEVIREAASLYLDRADEAVVTLQLAEGLPQANIDSEQLKRVFVNLIDNAIEAPGSGERSINLSTRFEAARDVLVAEVSDNGSGIDPADYPRLFQPYFSTKGRGTGLGLAIVNRIVTEHHGKIRAVPNQPGGAKFIVEIPTLA
ncbi:MAG: HAMP domain-containing protein [Chloracidobacterium sp.]|nr:HAMP domain-containing protein [Chloracidobacterium sp.]